MRPSTTRERRFTSSDESLERVPVLRPSLPDADRLLPYLRRIDAARVYTNWGPLTGELHGRLAEHFRVPDSCVTSASSGTAALVGAILGAAGRAKPHRPLALIPAYTFVATAIAVEQCGYEPYLIDVDPDTWLMDLDRLVDHPLLNRTGLVVGVAAYGRPIAQATATAFRSATGVPVVIDGGASFENIVADPARYVSAIPVALSFHATKSFSTGEGGCVVTTDVQLSGLVTRALNFGFFSERRSQSPSTNGKMSEYHAAVGLAELDDWPRKRLRLRQVADSYRDRFDRAGLAGRFFGAPTVAGCYALFQCAGPDEAHRVKASLTRAGAEFRLWYGKGLLDQPHYQELRHDPLPVTERVSSLVLGLPVAVDLADSTISRIVAAVASGTSDGR